VRLIEESAKGTIEKLEKKQLTSIKGSLPPKQNSTSWNWLKEQKIESESRLFPCS